MLFAPRPIAALLVLRVTLVGPSSGAAQQIRYGYDDLGRLVWGEDSTGPVPEVAISIYVADAMVNSQTGPIIDTARAKKLPTMVPDRENVVRGVLANYGVSYYAFGRLSAKHVRRVLLGAEPGGLPVEQFNRLHFTINVKTAKALGLTVPQSVLFRADEVLE